MFILIWLDISADIEPVPVYILPRRVSAAAGMWVWSFIKSPGGLIWCSFGPLLTRCFKFKMLLKNLFCSKSSWWPGFVKVRGQGLLMDTWFWCHMTPLISVSSELLSITLESWIPSHRCLETRRLFDKWRASRRSPCRCQPGLSEVYFSEGFFWSSGSASPAKIHPEEKVSLKKKRVWESDRVKFLLQDQLDPPGWYNVYGLEGLRTRTTAEYWQTKSVEEYKWAGTAYNQTSCS